MKQFLIGLLSCFLTWNIVSGQCPESSIFITSQEELDAFGQSYPDCTELNVAISILESDVSDLSPLSKIEKSANFSILVNENLTSLVGLENLRTASIFSIVQVNNIKDFSPLANLSKVSQLRVNGNSSLESFEGLENLLFTGSVLSISDNPNLVTIEALSNVEQVSSIWIVNNDKLEKLPEFYKLTEHNRNTTTNLIIDNDNLISLKGLDSINRFSRFDIINNPRLKNLDGLQNMSISNDGIWLDISGNDSLKTLTGLQNIDTVFAGTIYGNIYIKNNPLLEDLAGLNNLKYMEGNLEIESNQSLSSLTGLKNLRTVYGDIFINDNSSLTSLEGLDSLDYAVFNTLTITNCSDLSFCSVQSVCSAIANNASVTIEFNDSGCNNNVEVNNICITDTKELSPNKPLFYPNPVSNRIYLQDAISNKTDKIILYDTQGEKVSFTKNNNNEIDLSSLDSGVYFLQIHIQTEVTTLKVIKL